MKRDSRAKGETHFLRILMTSKNSLLPAFARGYFAGERAEGSHGGLFSILVPLLLSLDFCAVLLLPLVD